MSELTLLHVQQGEIGYGRMGIEVHRQLLAKQIDVYDGLASPEEANKAFEGDRRYGMTNVVMWQSVPTHARGWFEGQVPIINTMWETDHLPESFRENLHAFDTVIVPSRQNVELFSEYHPNVRLAPLGVDPQVWCYQPRRPPETRFNFLAGGSGTRKGVDLVVRAFAEVFGQEGSWPHDGPVPYLMLKSPKAQDTYGPRIEQINGHISADEEVDLYAMAHCYVQPSRGEGFGLQPLQAIAQGCPTILTDAHGHEAFAQHGMGISASMVPAGYFIYGDAGQWWEPDCNELCQAMYWTYHNYDQACRDADLGSAAVLEQFTWSHTADAILDAIGYDRLGPYVGSGRWLKPTSKLYALRTTQDWKADIAGETLLFEAGKQVYTSADVKRILFEAGLLEPSCVTGPDSGLLPEQLARTDAYCAAQGFCPLCDQKLGSGITRADQIIAESEAQVSV